MDPAFFRLTRNPFERNPGLDEACLPAPFADLVRDLVAGLHLPRTITIVVGHSGAGKTMIASVLATTLGRDATVARVTATSPDLDTLVRELLEQLDPGLVREPGFVPTLEALGRATANQRGKGTPVVLLVDDAHQLPSDAIRSLCQSSHAHVVVLGRPALLDSLGRALPEGGATPFDQVRVRSVTELGRELALDYLADRVAAAGGRVDALFSPSALARIVEATDGLATRLEDLAAAVLEEAQGAGQREIGIATVERVLARGFPERRSEVPPPAPPPPAPEPADVELTDVEALDVESTDVAPAVEPTWLDPLEPTPDLPSVAAGSRAREPERAPEEEPVPGIGGRPEPPLRTEAPEPADERQRAAMAALRAERRRAAEVGREREPGAAKRRRGGIPRSVWWLGAFGAAVGAAAAFGLFVRDGQEGAETVRAGETIPAIDSARALPGESRGPHGPQTPGGSATDDGSLAGSGSAVPAPPEPPAEDPEGASTGSGAAELATASGQPSGSDPEVVEAPAPSGAEAIRLVDEERVAVPASAEWVVQVGAFRSRRNAEGLAEKLRAIDPGATVRARGNLHFVVTHAFSTEADAASFAPRIREMGFKTYVRRWAQRS